MTRSLAGIFLDPIAEIVKQVILLLKDCECEEGGKEAIQKGRIVEDETLNEQ